MASINGWKSGGFTTSFGKMAVPYHGKAPACGLCVSCEYSVLTDEYINTDVDHPCVCLASGHSHAANACSDGKHPTGCSGYNPKKPAAVAALDAKTNAGASENANTLYDTVFRTMGIETAGGGFKGAIQADISNVETQMNEAGLGLAVSAVKLMAGNAKKEAEEKARREAAKSPEEKFLDAFRNLRDKEKTSDRCLAAVSLDPSYIEYVPKKSRTEDICFVVVSRDARLLKYVPDELKTDSLYMAAVCGSDDALKFIPDDKKTKELCFLAAQKKSSALKWIPDRYKTSELYFEMVRSDPQAFKLVPADLQNAEICLAAVQGDPQMLKNVSGALKTPELCLEAVTKNGGALHHVPEALRTLELCKAAVAQDKKASLYVPENLYVELGLDKDTSLGGQGIAMARSFGKMFSGLGSQAKDNLGVLGKIIPGGKKDASENSGDTEDKNKPANVLGGLLEKKNNVLGGLFGKKK